MMEFNDKRPNGPDLIRLTTEAARLQHARHFGVDQRWATVRAVTPWASTGITHNWGKDAHIVTVATTDPKTADSSETRWTTFPGQPERPAVIVGGNGFSRHGNGYPEVFGLGDS